MKAKAVFSGSIIGLLLVSAFWMTLSFAPQVHATSVNLATLPNCTTSTGLFWDSANQVAWQPCYDTGILYKEDFSTQPATLTHNSTVHTWSLSSSSACHGIAISNTEKVYVANTTNPLRHEISAVGRLSRAANVGLVDGKATVEAVWPKAGTHSLVMALGSAVTLPLNVTVGPSSNSVSSSVSVPLGFCQPWFAYNVSTMLGWVIIYQSDSVRIWKVNV